MRSFLLPFAFLLPALTACAAGASPNADPGLVAFVSLNNDVSAASSFCDKVQNVQAVQENEKLQFFADEEQVFGEAFACRGDNCHTVFIRPIGQIAHYWLRRMQADFIKLKTVTPTDPLSVKFVSKLKSAHEQQDSVWTKLGMLYCRLEPEGKYVDLSSSVVYCHDLSR